MRHWHAVPRQGAGILGAALMVLSVPAAQAFSAKPDDPRGAKVVGHLMTTNFTKQCDVNTYPLRKNLSFLFDNKYIGLKFQSWEVNARSGETFGVILHYIDGEAGPTTAHWQVDMEAMKARMGDDNAEVLSCMTGYL